MCGQACTPAVPLHAEQAVLAWQLPAEQQLPQRPVAAAAAAAAVAALAAPAVQMLLLRLLLLLLPASEDPAEPHLLPAQQHATPVSRSVRNPNLLESCSQSGSERVA